MIHRRRAGIRIVPVLAALLVHLSPAAGLRADPETAAPAATELEGEKLVEELFGEQLRQVAATREIDDDLALAELMIQTAASNKQYPQLLEAACFRIADDLGRRVGGHEFAARALSLLCMRKPELRGQALQRLIEVRKHESTVARANDRTAALAAVVVATLQLAELYAEQDRLDDALRMYQEAHGLARRIRMRGTADAITAILDSYRPLIEALRRADLLKSRLKANPDDKVAARQLVMLYLLELDDPAEARKFAFLVADAELETRIKLASAPPDQATEADALTMADWYESLAPPATPDTPASVRQTILRRTAAYLQRYLALHTAADLDRTKAEIRLRTTTAALADLSRPATRP